MRIESLSIKAVTVIIFSMIGMVAVILSILAGSYFKQAALNAQMNSLSRVIEVASQEILKELKNHPFDLGMKMAHNQELIQATQQLTHSNKSRLTALLDDPFISGFVGFSMVSLEKIRVYDLNLELLAESQQGMNQLDKQLAPYLHNAMLKRKGVERLKSIDALWLSSNGPMHSTVVPIGGLRLIGYLEIMVNPAFNLPNISKITRAPISIYSASGEPITVYEADIEQNSYLPIHFTLRTSDGQAAFRITGYENVATLSMQMDRTQTVTISGFLVLSLLTLLFALWLFNRFLFSPLRLMIHDMKQVSRGQLDLSVNEKGLSEFNALAETFNLMASQVRMRANDLERLLDLDGSAILCFGSDNEAVYFNKAASKLFAYSSDEIIDLDVTDLFSEDLNQLMKRPLKGGSELKKLHTELSCKPSEGQGFQSNAVISLIDVKDASGYAVVLNPVLITADVSVETTSLQQQTGQHMDVIDQSLNKLLQMAKTNPNLLASLTSLEQAASQGITQGSSTDTTKLKLRERVVVAMQCALECWTYDLNRSKLDLAEESKIWPVYIDKSTPTTRTLDKYLHIDSCPKNPRCQRVIDTAEFVLKRCSDQQTKYKQKLIDSLEALRQSISGV